MAKAATITTNTHQAVRTENILERSRRLNQPLCVRAGVFFWGVGEDE